jgi:GxxExxY protein
MQFESESRLLLGAAIAVHRAMGPGLLESVYSRCLAMELKQQGLRVRREVVVPLFYRGVPVGADYRIDLVVADRIVVEVKSVQRLGAVHKAQLLTYLRLTGIRVGFLLNFNTAVMKDGITRLVL